MRSLWNQCEHTIKVNTVVMGNMALLRDLEFCRQKMTKFLEEIDSKSKNISSDELDKCHLESSEDKAIRLNEMIDDLRVSNTKAISIICSRRIFIISMGFYLLGFGIFASYIISFMICHM